MINHPKTDKTPFLKRRGVALILSMCVFVVAMFIGFIWLLSSLQKTPKLKEHPVLSHLVSQSIQESRRKMYFENVTEIKVSKGETWNAKVRGTKMPMHYLIYEVITDDGKSHFSKVESTNDMSRLHLIRNPQDSKQWTLLIEEDKKISFYVSSLIRHRIMRDLDHGIYRARRKDKNFRPGRFFPIVDTRPWLIR